MVGEFDSCAIHAHVTLLWGRACISSISAASWITIADDWDDWFASTRCPVLDNAMTQDDMVSVFNNGGKKSALIAPT